MFEMSLLVGMAVLAAVGTGIFRRVALKRGLLDRPNERSSHTVPTPRGGGIVFVGLWLIAVAGLFLTGQLSSRATLALLPGALAVAAVGYLDDLRQVSARTRAAVHVAAGAFAVMMIGGFETMSFGPWTLQLGVFGYGFATLAIAWSINLFNFMDGTDGISSTEGIFVLGFGGAFLAAVGSEMALPAWLLAAALTGFFLWNKPQAKIFMGDAGSGFIGLLIGVFAISGETTAHVPALLWLVLYAVFVCDATVTLARRILKGEKWYVAHRSHAYQRLVHGAGWSHRKVLGGVIVLNVLLASLAVKAFGQPDMLPFALVATIVLAGLALGAVERIAPR